MDRFEAIAAFRAVVEAGSFTAASRRLRVPLATVSRRVTELEAVLAVRLLNRTTRRVALTDVGRQFFEASRRILEDLGEAKRAATGEGRDPHGELVVTAPIVFGRLHLVPMIATFLARFPAVDVTLLLNNRPVSLIDENIDLALRIGELGDSSMVAIRIGSAKTLVCAAPGYLDRHGTPAHPADLARHDCIAFTGLSGSREWPFPIGRKRQMIPIRTRLVVTTAEAAIDAAIAGVGITRVLSYQVGVAIKERRLRPLLSDFEFEPVPVHFAHLSGRLVSAKLRAFLDFATPRLRSRLQSAL